MNLTILGTGYVGLVTAACFAECGYRVTAVDTNAKKIAVLKGGGVPIYEPGLAELLRGGKDNDLLQYTTDIATALAEADMVFICVGTPPRADGSADTTSVMEAAASIVVHVQEDAVIVTKSTVPIGTNRILQDYFDEHCAEKALLVASNPEFLREGAAIQDFMRPDRVVIGAAEEDAADMLTQLYQPICGSRVPVVVTSFETAEMIKYAANTFLAAKVALINEMADVCEAVGADIEQVAHAVGLDERIGSRFLRAGPGYGGSCFPKDTQALLVVGQHHDITTPITEAVVTSNLSRRERMVKKIIRACGGSVQGKTLAILGVTYKPGTNDLRESPALSILPALSEAGAALRIYDPEGMDSARRHFSYPTEYYCSSTYAALEGADAAVILTEWKEFAALDLVRLKTLLTKPLLIDLRNLYLPALVRKAGVRYVSVGRSDA